MKHGQNYIYAQLALPVFFEANFINFCGFYSKMESATEEAIKLGLPKTFITEHKCPKCSGHVFLRGKTW